MSISEEEDEEKKEEYLASLQLLNMDEIYLIHLRDIV